MRFLIDQTKSKRGTCSGCGKHVDRLWYLAGNWGWCCESCITNAGVIFEHEMKIQLPGIRAALDRLLSHLPPGVELLDAELCFNPVRNRFELLASNDRYWFGDDCLICLQAGIVTYYKNGEGYSAPPPHRN
jgi:hypothetical protein